MEATPARKSMKKGQIAQPSPSKKAEKAEKIEMNPEKENMTLYEMLSVNCEFKKPIKKLLKSVERVRLAKSALEDKYGQLREDLAKLKHAPVYVPVKGDQVDEMFAVHLNASGLAVPLKRLSPGKYLFGTKQILAKIINGKLVVRVGGGYMSAEEFIETYGRIEMMKL